MSVKFETEISILSVQGTTGITYFCKPCCPGPLAVRLQVAAGVCSLVYQAEQLHALWKTEQQPLVTVQLAP